MPATVVFPVAVKQQGNTSVLFIATLANPAAPALVAELGAASTVNVSCYLYSGGQITSTQNRGAAPRRLCTVTELQQFGTQSTEITDIQYVYGPQAANTDPSNTVKAALAPDTQWWMLVRRGLSAQNTAYAAGQKATVVQVRVGPQNEGVTGDGEFDEYAILQSVIALAPPVAATIAA